MLVRFQLCYRCLLSLVLFSQAAQLPAAIIFRDDFEDDTVAANPPALNLVSSGGDDMADVGSGWTSTLGGTNAGVRANGANQYLDLGLAVANGDVRTTSGARLVTGTLPTTLLAAGTVTIEFDLTWDFTSNGSQGAHMYLLSGGASGTPLLDLNFIRGATAAGKRIDVAGISTSQGVIQVTQDSDVRHVTITLNPTSFNLAVDGNLTPNLTNLSYLSAATSFDALQFMNSAQAGGRILQLDNLVVNQFAVPEPAAALLIVTSTLLVWNKLRRRTSC
jgi:hypothetical protein